MKISILGCGWLGLPLAKRLLAEGHIVKGSTTDRDKLSKLTQEGITPYEIKIYVEGIQGDITSFLSDAELLIIDIPPGLRNDPDANFIGRIGRLKDFIEKSGVSKVIFVSSTSVYEDEEIFPKYTEMDPANAESNASKQLISAEEHLRASESFKTTIVRFGGLFGPGRHPVTYLAGKTGIKNPDAPVNMIHQNDCIEIISNIIKNEAWDETFNAVYHKHSSKEAYYTQQAQERKLAMPQFDNEIPSKGKVVDSINLKEILGYTFKHNLFSPLEEV